MLVPMGKRPREQHASVLYKWRRAGGSGCWRAAGLTPRMARGPPFARVFFCSTASSSNLTLRGTCSSLLTPSAMLRTFAPSFWSGAKHHAGRSIER